MTETEQRTLEYRKILKYDWPCYPTGLRYHPTHTYVYPYPPTGIAYTDRMHGKCAIYFPIRDQVGCIEIGQMLKGNNTSPKKRIYIDHSPWYRQDGLQVECMDMSFGYDYQRLYILFKQPMADNDTYRAWVCQFDTNQPDGTWLKSQPCLPLYGFIQDKIHVHPFAPTDMSSVMDYLEEVGLTGELINKPELDPTFNVLSVYDKLFVTIPVLFKPRSTPWDRETIWTPSDARLLYQLMFMFNETYATFESCAIVGAISPWIEDYRVPLPDIEPKRPFKLRMNLIDDNVVWMLAQVRKFPATWYTDWPTKDHYPGYYYQENMWDGSNSPNRFWQPLTTEAIHIDDLITEMESHGDSYIKPFRLSRALQYYTQTPLISDLYHKAVPDWTGQRVFGTRGPDRHVIQEYNVKYHNFKRKLVAGNGSHIEKTEVEVPIERMEFRPFSVYSGDPRRIPYAQDFQLKRGRYIATIRGADGGPAHHIAPDGTETYLSSGGAGAMVKVTFELKRDADLTAYAGKAGGSNTRGWPCGGEGGSHIVSPSGKVDPIWENIFDVTQVFEKEVEQTFNVPIAGYAFFFKVPAGAKEFHMEMTRACTAHNASIQVMHTDGTLLTGTKNLGNTMWDWYVNNRSVPTNQDISDKLVNAYPLVFGGGINFDDSQVNGGLATQVPWSAMKEYKVAGETIQWTGNSVLGRPTNSTRGINVEELYIEEAQEDLIIGVLSTHFFGLKATWDETTVTQVDPPVDELPKVTVYGGGGGGLSGLFLDDFPIAIAGSGGGGGCEDEGNEPSTTTRNGGHGGNLSGGYGQFGGVNTTAPGTQDTGYMLFYGEDVVTPMSGGGGGGAGYRGGEADQIAGQARPGGGGGSSYLVGVSPYSEYHDLPSVEILSYEVTEGSGSPGQDAEDGYVILEGVYYEERETEVEDYAFIDHDLGDFYYQCGGEPGQEVIESPLPTVLDVIILNDCTTSMHTYISTLAGAMPALVNGISGGDFDEAHYAVASYANYQTLLEDAGSGKHFTDQASVVESMMQHSADICKDRSDNYWIDRTNRVENPNIPFGSGDSESWAHAMTDVVSKLGSEKIGNNTMFVIITDDVNKSDNPSALTTPALDLCKSLNATVVWVLPDGYGADWTDEAQESIDVNHGSKLTVMNATTSDWGNDVAEAIAELQPEPTIKTEIKLTGVQVMAIENLSCNTFMRDVHLKSTYPGLTFDFLPEYQPLLIGWDGPVHSEIAFDEIPPHSEALFAIKLNTGFIPANAATFNGHSYKIYNEAVTWQEAKERCEELGGHLVTITSAEEQAFIQQYLTPANNTWLGATDEGSEGNWRWVTGETFSYTNWASGEPNNLGGDENYAHFYGSTGLWNDEDATYKAGFICEWDRTVPTCGCFSLQDGVEFSYYLEARNP